MEKNGASNRAGSSAMKCLPRLLTYDSSEKSTYYHMGWARTYAWLISMRFIEAIKVPSVGRHFRPR